MTNCIRCNRVLKNPASIKAGIGPICAHKNQMEVDMESNKAFNDVEILEPIQAGIILSRTAKGECATNVPHVVTHHSPTGFEFGYAGSGPADLALNIVEIILNNLGYEGKREKCWHGDCWALAFQLHQSFKFQFISPVPRLTGGVIQYSLAEEWVRSRMQIALAEQMDQPEFPFGEFDDGAHWNKPSDE